MEGKQAARRGCPTRHGLPARSARPGPSHLRAAGQGSAPESRRGAASRCFAFVLFFAHRRGAERWASFSAQTVAVHPFVTVGSALLMLSQRWRRFATGCAHRVRRDSWIIVIGPCIALLSGF